MSTDDLVLNSRMQVCTSIKQAPSRYLYVLGHIFAWHWCSSGKQPLVVYRGNEPYLQLKLRRLMAQSHLHQATAYPGCQTSMSIFRNFFWLGHVAGFSLLYRRPWRLRTKILCYHCLRKMCQNLLLDYLTVVNVIKIDIFSRQFCMKFIKFGQDVIWFEKKGSN